MEQEEVLITGGSGFIGSRLTEMLLKRGYKVTWLSRSKGKNKGVEVYKWDLNNGFIDEEAIKKANFIIHLAGANIAGKRWSKAYKKEILRSRTESTDLLFQYVSKLNPNLRAFISASAIGIYGLDRGEEWITEDSEKGNDFLASTIKKWEEQTEKFNSLNIRTVKLRTGIVLSSGGGALKKMALPVKYGVGAVLGSGKQYVSWIHLDDLCDLYINAIEKNNIEGVYNAVAPGPVTNKKLMHSIAQALNRKIILPKVPGFVLRILFGELILTVLGGAKVSGEKIEKTGYKFKFNTIEEALNNLYHA